MKNRRFKYWMSGLIFILILIAMPMPEYNGTVETYYDKVVHFIMFGGFSLLTAWWLKAGVIMNRHKRIIISVCAGIAYAGLGEFIQNYVPGRTVSELDFLAGFAGALFALIFLYAFRKA